MKTQLFLIAALFISTITSSQTSKKGYDYYKASSDTKINKAELIDVIAKDATLSRKRIGETLKKPQKRNVKKSNDLILRKRPGRSQGDPVPGIGITREQAYKDGADLYIRKRPGRTKNHNVSSNNTTSSKATDYNSSRSNKNSNR